ncbi:MAG TPA: hypothetical protein VMT34_06210, partial [Aggregatilineales bacterium]|nr:hypothetical protein [Aggregatilineales bacterium]
DNKGNCIVSDMTTVSKTHRRLSLFGNPVVLKELRGRMRGPRAFVVLTVYLLLMSGFAALLYVLFTAQVSAYGYAATGRIGQTLFIGVVGMELFLVTFIAPSFTASAITGERERQTYDLLRTTTLRASSLVIGKLTSALSYVMLLLLAAVPLQSIAFLFGGVTEIELVLSFAILVVTAVALGAVGIYFSALVQRSVTASVLTYAFALFVTLGLPLIAFIVLSFALPVLGINPYGPTSISLAGQALLVYGFGFFICTNPLATALFTEMYILTPGLVHSGSPIGYFTQTLTYSSPTGPSSSVSLPLVSPWIGFTVFYLVLSGILVLLAIRRVRKIDR